MHLFADAPRSDRLLFLRLQQEGGQAKGHFTGYQGENETCPHHISKPRNQSLTSVSNAPRLSKVSWVLVSCHSGKEHRQCNLANTDTYSQEIQSPNLHESCSCHGWETIRQSILATDCKTLSLYIQRPAALLCRSSHPLESYK